MKIRKWQKICLVILLSPIVLGLGLVETWAADDHVPSGVTMQEEFQPGYGETLGIFKKSIGRVVLIHAEDPLGYWAQNDLPLYMKDKVVTPEDGLALLQFLDESTISVAAESELVINRFIFDPDKFDRSAFLSMDSGRSRFWVKKLQGYTRSEFKVKTKTLIAGVRGSDFILIVGPDSTEVIALDDTVLEIIILATGKVIELRSNEKVRIGANGEVSVIEKITPEEAARLKNEMPMPFDKDVMDAGGVFKLERTIDPETGRVIQPTYEVGGLVIGPGRVPEGDLVPPEPPTDEETSDGQPFDEPGWTLPNGPGEDLPDQIGDAPAVFEPGIINDIILVPLPDLPVTP